MEMIVKLFKLLIADLFKLVYCNELAEIERELAFDSFELIAVSEPRGIGYILANKRLREISLSSADDVSFFSSPAAFDGDLINRQRLIASIDSRKTILHRLNLTDKK